MKKILSKIIGTGVIFVLFLVPVLVLKAENNTATEPVHTVEQVREKEQARLEQIKEIEKARLEQIREKEKERLQYSLGKASSTVKNLENREDNLEQIRKRIELTAASSTRKLEKLNNQFKNQNEQMEKVRERLLEKELKVIEVLRKISDKIIERISIIEATGKDLTKAKEILTAANNKIVLILAETDKLTVKLETEITEENKDSLFQEIRTIQNQIRIFAKDIHSNLILVVKEIGKVLSAKSSDN